MVWIMHMLLIMILSLLIYQLYFDLRLINYKLIHPPLDIKAEYDNYLEKFTDTKSTIHSIHEFNINNF